MFRKILPCMDCARARFQIVPLGALLPAESRLQTGGMPFVQLSCTYSEAHSQRAPARTATCQQTAENSKALPLAI